MMKLPTCEEVERFAYDFLDQNLDNKTLQAVERHLRFCKNCQKFIKSYRLMVKKIKLAPPPPLEKEFKEKMLAFLKTEKAK